MKDYNVARNLFTFIELVLWFGVLLGLVGAFALMGTASRGYGTAPGLLAAIPGIALALASLFGIALTQMGRAAVDSAEYGQQALKVARDQLEVSKQAMKESAAFQNSFADLIKRAPAQADTPQPDAARPQASYATEPAEAVSSDDADTPVISGDTLKYRGQVAKLIEHRWNLNGIGFQSKEKLVEYIDSVGLNASQGSRRGAIK